MTMQRLFAPKKKQRTGLSFILFAFTFLCVIGAACFVALLGIRGGVIKSAAPQVRDFAFSIGLLDPSTCVVDATGRLDCRADAVGTPIRLALGQLKQAQSDLAGERSLRLAAEAKAKDAAEALRRLADMSQSQRMPVPASAPDSAADPAADIVAEQSEQPYLMLPGDVVQPFSKRVTLVYRQPVGTDAVLISSDLWQGDRKMEFYKVYHATLDEPGLSGDVALVVTPHPAWRDGNRSIHLALKPQATIPAR